MTQATTNHSLPPSKVILIGAVMIILLILLNILIGNPSPYLYSCYKLLAAAGMACVANGLTGVFDLKIGTTIKASGSLAIMAALIYLYPFSDNQNSLYKGCIYNDPCFDYINHAYIVINDYQTMSVTRGDTIYIDELNGKQDLGPVVGVVGPEGTRTGLFNLSLDKYCIDKDIPHGALMYKLSNSKDWAPLSKVKQIIIADNNINLELDINDKEKGNNFGFFFVKLRICHYRKLI